MQLWLGISTDESARIRPSGVGYVTNRWPLIERGMSRADCVDWLGSHGLNVPAKSACTFCPFHGASEWRQVYETAEDWAEAVMTDRLIRHMRGPHQLFVHPGRIPLEQVDLRTAEERGQLRLWDEECTGVCGV